jgi:peptidoglycan biosynthesis protein MviN/MurJ (putative lipid II flippase)
LVKLVASAITIGSGGSGGREGPTAQISSGFGSALADWLHLTTADRRIALATGIAGWIQLALFLKGLRGLPVAKFDARFKSAAWRIVLSACVMSAVLFITAKLTDTLQHGESLEKITALGLIVGGGFVAYALATALTGAVNVRELKGYLKRKKV